jgi:PAS domain S-box-containing protein
MPVTWASQAIIETLMRAAIQGGGAERAVLVDGESLAIAAEAQVAGTGIEVVQHGFEPGRSALPGSIVERVTQTGAPVVLADARRPGPFASDPYIMSRRPRSVLCLPIEKKARPMAVLYLENARHAAAFVPARLSLLEMLASQAAVSLRNARVYTDLERHNETHRQAEDRLRAILDSLPDGIITLDERGVIETVNPAAARIFGYAPEDLLGRGIGSIIPAPLREAHDGYVASYLETGAKNILGMGREVTGLRRDGSTFPMELTVSEFPSGGRRYFSGTIRDVSARKRLEERLRQQQAQRIHGQRLITVGEMAATMAHELNQPLGAISNYAGAATLRFRRELQANPALGELLEHVTRLSERAAEVVRGFRGLVRQDEAGWTWVNVNALIVETVRLIGTDVAERSVTVGLHLAPDIPLFLGQRIHLQQVLLNVILNALNALDALDAMDAMDETDAAERRLDLLSAPF